MLQQLRPVLQRADPDDRAARRSMKEVAAIAKGVAERKPRPAIRALPAATIGPVVDRHPVGQDPGADPEGHCRRRNARRRRAGPARRRQQGLLCAPDGVRRRHQRHDHRARGDLRAGAVDPRLRRTKAKRSASPTTRPTAWRVMSRPGPLKRARKVGRQLRAGNININGTPQRPHARPSAATSNPATAASGASSAWKSTSK